MPRCTPTHLLEFCIEEFQPVGVDLIQVVAAASWPVRMGTLTKCGAIRGHLCRGAFQWWEEPGKPRMEVVKGGALACPPWVRPV